MHSIFRLAIAASICATSPFAVAQDSVGWHDAFNDYFSASLEDPTYEEMRSVLADHLNQQTVTGVSPQLELLKFNAFVDDTREAYGRRAVRGVVVKLYENLLDYLSVESQFDQLGLSQALEEANEVVKRQRYITPNWNDDLSEQIPKVMAKRQRLVPPTVLFGVSLHPYRAVAPPEGMTLRAANISPEVTAGPNTTRMLITVPEGSGPVARLDFETIDMQGLIIEASDTGRQFTAVDHVTDPHPSGIRPPVILRQPVEARYLRLVGTSRTGPAHIRQFRMYTLEEAD